MSVLPKLRGSTFLLVWATPQSKYISKSAFKVRNITQHSLLVQWALRIWQSDAWKVKHAYLSYWTSDCHILGTLWTKIGCWVMLCHSERRASSVQWILTASTIGIWMPNLDFYYFLFQVCAFYKYKYIEDPCQSCHPIKDKLDFQYTKYDI